MSERANNRPGKERCHKCQNTGFVLLIEEREEAGVAYGNLTAPCPGCALGFAIEFGETGERRWPGGYWKGQSETAVIAMPAGGASLSKAEGMKLSQAYQTALRNVGRSVETPKDRKRRAANRIGSLDTAGEGECADCKQPAFLFVVGRFKVCGRCAESRLAAAA